MTTLDGATKGGPVRITTTVALCVIAATAQAAESPRWVGGIDTRPGGFNDFSWMTAVQGGEVAPAAAPEPIFQPAPGAASALDLSVPDSAITPLSTEYLLDYPRTVWRVVSQPARWSGRDWMAAGAVAAGVGGLFLLDETIKDAMGDSRGDTTEAMADFFRPFGNTTYALGASVGAWAVGEASGSTSLQRVGLNGVQAILVAQLLTEGVKRISGRLRPTYTDDSTDFAGPNGDSRRVSFPSGHATVAFAAAAVVAEEWKDEQPWVPYLAYGLAAGTALSRVHDDKHWASDVAVGSLIGLGTGLVVSRYSPFTGSRYRVLPLAVPDGGGLSIGLRM